MMVGGTLPIDSGGALAPGYGDWGTMDWVLRGTGQMAERNTGVTGRGVPRKPAPVQVARGGRNRRAPGECVACKTVEQTVKQAATTATDAMAYMGEKISEPFRRIGQSFSRTTYVVISGAVMYAVIALLIYNRLIAR